MKFILYFKFILFFLFTVMSLQSFAITVSESFTSNTHIGSLGGAVWNISLGELHPPLLISGWDDGGGAQNTSFSVGDGSDGAFNLSRYSLFDDDHVVSSGIIEINTDTYPELQFTDFNLQAGYTIQPIGSRPLIIRVQGSMTIDGVINCSGGVGGNGSSTISALNSGGIGRCGGGDGGMSVAPGTAPAAVNQGVSGGSSTTGGSGGPINLPTGGQGGGGGGAYIKAYAFAPDKADPTSGDDSFGGVGGAVGTIFRDDAFQTNIDGSGSGGGGGSAFDDVGDPTHHSSGGGGGGGGGNIRIYSVGDINISATGQILASGGDGGSISGGLKGGAGGGGGGGSILMFSGGNIVIDGAVTAAAGSGGTTAGGVGGMGAWGRTWIIEKDGVAGGLNVEDPQSNLNVPGQSVYETGVTYTVTSSAIDLGSSRPTMTNLPSPTIVNLGASTVVYNLSFSDLTSLSSFPTFQVSTSFLNTELSRYLRFELQFDNTDAVNPIRIQNLDFEFSGFTQDEFKFISGCGLIKNLSSGSIGRDGGNKSSHNSNQLPNNGARLSLTNLIIFSFILLLPVFIIFLLRVRKTKITFTF